LECFLPLRRGDFAGDFPQQKTFPAKEQRGVRLTHEGAKKTFENPERISFTPGFNQVNELLLKNS
jgi:hypothetical protein